MQAFTRLYYDLDSTTRTADKVRSLEAYFGAAAPRDAAWALYFLIGRKINRLITTKLLREWTAQESGFPAWLLDECYETVGDLAEALALVLPETNQSSTLSLYELVVGRLVPLKTASRERQRELIRSVWRELDAQQRLVWHKLILGEFRVGVARTLVARALAAVGGVSPAVMSHRLMGYDEPSAESYLHLLSDAESSNLGQPYPFFLAYPLNEPPTSLGDVGNWQFEWKWDGIRAQLIRRHGDTWIWSRGEELISDSFPEIVEASQKLSNGTVLDGEILPWRGGQPLPFSVLQKRIGRKTIGRKLLEQAPVIFMGYDILEHDGGDCRDFELSLRRTTLEKLFDDKHGENRLRLSPILEPPGWDEVIELHAGARDRAVEGLMLKNKSSQYGVGRTRGAWWKWKVQPYSIDAVLIYAQLGHGRRADLYTDYTFGLWQNGKLVPVAKAYSGLTDEEIQEVDAFVRRNTLERTGPVRIVKPLLVFELHFEGIQFSKRHKAGVAVRFPRMARWRHDKIPADADAIDALRELVKEPEPPRDRRLF